MVHSGPPNVQELWGELEKRWGQLENHAKHLTRGTEDARDGGADMVRDNLSELREGYDRLASALRERRSEWAQVRNSLDRLVQGVHRTSDYVVSSVEDLADAATVRIKKARLERMRSKKRAELGKRVCELAKEPARFEEGPLRVLDDDEVKALLRDLGLLDADLRNAASRPPEPDRIEA
jgi:predicted nuclease with TOPRIM domain